MSDTSEGTGHEVFQALVGKSGPTSGLTCPMPELGFRNAQGPLWGPEQHSMSIPWKEAITADHVLSWKEKRLSGRLEAPPWPTGSNAKIPAGVLALAVPLLLPTKSKKALLDGTGRLG